MNYIVSIIGRQNVGKSTLFNRILGRKIAIVHERGGITRDRIYGNSKWKGVNFSLVDTGGFTPLISDLDHKIYFQIQQAIQESDVIFFVVDIRMGILDTDIEIASLIRKQNKPILLVINKVDHSKLLYSSDTDFFSLGFIHYYYISASNGSGVGELLDDLVDVYLKKCKKKISFQDQSFPKFSIIGRPNVGKSTLINSFLEKDQHIVNHLSGTTRDILNVFYPKFGYECILFDTPGLKKKSRIKENIEFYSMIRTIKAIEQTDICLLMIDGIFGWEKQDTIIFRMVEKYQKGVLILINKWDSVLKKYKKKNFSLKKDYEDFIRKKIYPFYNVPILFISAKKKDKIYDIIPIAFQIEKFKKNRLKTNLLNKVMLPIFKKTPPFSIKKNRNKKLITIKYCTQLPTKTPKFVFFSNFPQYIKQSYKRFIENKIRYYFDFKGVPMEIFFRKK